MANREKTYASNPGGLPFSFSRNIKCRPIMIAAPIIAFTCSIIFVLLKGIPIWVGLGIALIVAIVAVQSMATTVKRQLQDGNLCAALVVNTAPYTVAVLTDLCNDRSGSKLAIKIVQKPLQKMAGGPPATRDRLVAASTYFGEVGTGAWKDFNPLIANCACDDLTQITRAFNSIAPRDWQILEEAMKALKPTDLGLHFIDA